MEYVTVKLVGNLNEQQAFNDVNRIIYNANIPDGKVREMWKEAINRVMDKFNMLPDQTYFWNITYNEMKKILVDYLGNNLGPGAKLPLALLRDNLPYM